MLLYGYGIFDNTVLFFPLMVSSIEGEDSSTDEKSAYMSKISESTIVFPKENDTSESRGLNKKNNEPVTVKAREVEVSFFVKSAETPVWYDFLFISRMLLSFLAIIVLLIMIPYLYFTTLKQVGRNNIYSAGTIKKIRKLGYCVLFLSLYETFIKFTGTYTLYQLVELEHYRITFYSCVDYFGLIFSVTLLLVAEALRQALKMKEEQDLTI